MWAKIDDAILDNPKIVRAGPIGFALHVAAITYCSRNLTDGFVPYITARRLLNPQWTEDADEEGRVRIYSLAMTWGMPGCDGDEVIEHIIDLLVDVGLWQEVPHGYLLHDYLDYNPSREEVLASRVHLREVRQAAGRAGGTRSAAARREKYGSAQPGATEATPEASLEATPEAKGNQIGSPAPAPAPAPVLVEGFLTNASPVQGEGVGGGAGNHRFDLSPEAQRLLVGYADLAGLAPTPTDHLAAMDFVGELGRRLSVDEMLQRMQQHNEWCDTHGKQRPRTLKRYWETLRLEADHRATTRAPRRGGEEKIDSVLDRIVGGQQ